MLDSCPVPVCDIIRISWCKLLKGACYRGWQASMHLYFYGIKVQLITTSSGIPCEFSIVSVNQADVKAFYQLPFSSPAGSRLYAHAAYTNYVVEDNFIRNSKLMLIERMLLAWLTSKSTCEK